MSLRQRITEDMKAAMRSGDTKQRDTIRLLQAAIKQREVDERIVLDDAAVIAVIEKMLQSNGRILSRSMKLHSGWIWPILKRMRSLF